MERRAIIVRTRIYTISYIDIMMTHTNELLGRNTHQAIDCVHIVYIYRSLEDKHGCIRQDRSSNAIEESGYIAKLTRYGMESSHSDLLVIY
jgi:hypothetical protein